MFFVIEETKETVLDFSQGTIKILWAWFNFDQYKMTQYNNLNVKLSNSQLNKLNSAIKNESEVVLKLTSNMIGNDETDFPHKLLLTNRKVANLRKPLQIIYQRILRYQKLKYLRWYNQEDFLVYISSSITKKRITTNKKCS